MYVCVCTVCMYVFTTCMHLSCVRYLISEKSCTILLLRRTSFLRRASFPRDSGKDLKELCVIVNSVKFSKIPMKYTYIHTYIHVY